METIFSKISSFRRGARNWINSYAKDKNAGGWLFLFSFIEASFFPLPPSTLMTAIITSGHRKKWFYYATLTTVASVLGGLFGYLIGFVFYDTIGIQIIKAYDLFEEIEKVSVGFDAHAFLTIFIAAFTPIPYKVFALAAGFFKINILTFIVASFIGRGLRFYLLGWFLNFIEEKTGDKYIKHINTLAVLIAGIVILYFFLQLLLAAF